MNTALRNPFMLQEGTLSSFSFFLKEIAAERNENERERERDSQRPFISSGSFLVTRAVIFCLSASEEPSGPPSSTSSSSSFTVSSSTFSFPFLPRVRPHLDPRIWVRLHVYNLLRHQPWPREPRRRTSNSQIELRLVATIPSPPRRLSSVVPSVAIRRVPFSRG